MVHEKITKPLAITSSLRSRPLAQNIHIKKSLQPMVLRELSELHATVRFFTGYTDGNLEENVDMVMRQQKRGDMLNMISLKL